MIEVAIIADDLTGAADCGIAFALAGLPTFVALDDRRPPAGARVVAVDTDSRTAPERVAVDRVEAAARTAYASGTRTVYKKVDSTLRGHVAAEIGALARIASGAGRSRVPIVAAPAFPATGRTLERGEVLVGGVPLGETEVWRGSGMAGPSDLATMLRTRDLTATRISLEQVRGSGLASALERTAADVAICDAVTDADLAAIAAAGARLEGRVVWVGSGGLARHLPRALGLAPEGRAPPARWPRASRRVLTLVGSRSRVSHDQADALCRDGAASRLDLAPDRLLARNCGYQRQLRDLLRRNDVSAVIALQEPVDLGRARSLAAAVGALAASVRDEVDAVIATGGDIARATLQAMEASGIHLLGEVEPGVPVGLTESPRPIAFVTKAGAFGHQDTLAWARAALHASRESTMPDTLPIVGVTMGDPAGIGPEIIVKAFAVPEVHRLCRPLVIGDAGRLRRAAEIVGSTLHVRPIERTEAARFDPEAIEVIDLKDVPEDLPFGQLSASAGHAAYEYIARAVQLAMAGKLDAICTAPLNKEALHAGGHKYPGHTEMLAELSGTPEVSMMLMTPRMRVLHVTTHIGLLDAVEKIEPGLVERTIRRGYEALRRAGIENPRIAICGINPHAGEHGLFGRGEEEKKLQPAVEACRRAGIDVEGPLPADTLFFRAGRGDFDLVIANYHDQGHGPVKVLGLEAGVNVTVGLPFVRTSVDHGTAFDIAGTGKADERSMVEALRQAVALAPKRS